MPVPAWFSEVHRDLLQLSEINRVGGRRDTWRFMVGLGELRRISESHRESGGQYSGEYGGFMVALTASRSFPI